MLLTIAHLACECRGRGSTWCKQPSELCQCVPGRAKNSTPPTTTNARLSKVSNHLATCTLSLPPPPHQPTLQIHIHRYPLLCCLLVSYSSHDPPPSSATSRVHMSPAPTISYLVPLYPPHCSG